MSSEVGAFCPVRRMANRPLTRFEVLQEEFGVSTTMAKCLSHKGWNRVE